MRYLGDLAEDALITFAWSTNNRNGQAVAPTAAGTVEVYKGDGTTQSTAGLSDTRDFDGVTGLHLCKIDTSADAFYAAGHDYHVVLSGATIQANFGDWMVGPGTPTATIPRPFKACLPVIVRNSSSAS